MSRDNSSAVHTYDLCICQCTQRNFLPVLYFVDSPILDAKTHAGDRSNLSMTVRSM
jgi:hypothetical protein